jgi:hypothetical protein
MISFLFWNLNQKPLQKLIAKLSSIYDIDIFMFAEFSIDYYELLLLLNKYSKNDYYYAPGIGCQKIHIFSRFSETFVSPLHESSDLTIRHLNLPGLSDILLAVNHFPSKLYWDETSQLIECIKLANSILDAENDIGHSRTILVGDFNMNPFESGVISSEGLHAVMSRNIASKGKRVVKKKEYPFFYNPMWNFFGDASPGPAGTYYYTKSTHKVFFWNIFDQMLIRPDLLKYFDNDDLMIITSIEDTNLLGRNGFPDKNKGSDHLPIFFKLSI